MSVQMWILSVGYSDGGRLTRHAVVGPAQASTVEAALRLSVVPEDARVEIRANALVREFVEGRLSPEAHGFYAAQPCHQSWWAVAIGPVHAVL